MSSVAPYAVRHSRRPGRRVAGWTCMARLGMRSILAYRSILVWGSAGILVQIALTVVVWRTVYAGRPAVDGVPLEVTLGYVTLAACVQTALLPWQFSSLPRRIHLGQIATDLTRPLGLMGQVLGQDAGALLAQAPIALVGAGFAITLGAVPAPADIGTALAAFLSLLLGALIAMQLNLLMSMVAFWTVQVDGPLMLYRFAAAFASGAVIPLWFMPAWLAGALGMLPFSAQVAVPLSIYLGLRTGPALIIGLLTQAGWVVGLAAAQQLVWLRARHKVVVQGG